MAKLTSNSGERVRAVVNSAFLKAAGGAQRPPLQPASPIFPAAALFESQMPAIQREVDELLRTRRVPLYGDLDPVRAAEVDADAWKLYFVNVLGKENPQAAAVLPTLTKTLRKVKGVVNACISVLDPGVSLAAHNGPYAGILRYHLGLRIPRLNPPTIRVDGEHYEWREGESIVLDDTFEHEVTNTCDESRVVLIVDFLRPLPVPLTLLNRSLLLLGRRGAQYLQPDA